MMTGTIIATALLILNGVLYVINARCMKNLYGYRNWLDANYTRGRGVADLTAYVARDIDGRLFAYRHAPLFVEATGVWFDDKQMQLPEQLLPELTVYDEPIKVEIEIRIRNIKNN